MAPVTLISKIRDNATDSFFKGDVFVAVKSSIMQPSTVVRAHTELGEFFHRQMNPNQTIGILLTGGPEHNNTFTSVQVALVLLWRKLNLDVLLVGRSCPQNSWTDNIKRVMSVLNLALYSMCFSRPTMQPNNSFGSSASSSSLSSETSDTEDENSSLWLEQHWRSAKNMSQCR